MNQTPSLIHRRSLIGSAGLAVVSVLCTVALCGSAELGAQGFSSDSGQGGAVLYGYVTDGEGHPLAGVEVEAFLRSAHRAAYEITDIQGYYSLPLPEKSDFWEIRLRLEGYYPTTERLSIWRDRERWNFSLAKNPDSGLRAVEKKDRRKARKIMQEGLEKAGSGDREGAIEDLRLALDLDPVYTPALNNLGVQLRMTGDIEGAEKAFRRATELESLDYFAHYNLGALLYDTGRYSEATEMLERATLADPTSPLAKAALGRAFLATGQGEPALKCLREAGDLSGGQLDLQLEISDALIMQREWAQAIAAKQEWLIAHPEDEQAPHVQSTIEKLQERQAAENSAPAEG